MFQDACNAASKFMQPAITVWADKSNEVGYSIGAGVLLNDEGWFLTAGHILRPIIKLNQGKKAGDIKDYHFEFGQIGKGLKKIHIRDQLDFGVGRISAFTARGDQQYGILRKRPVRQGELLCRIGYPFLAKPKLEYGSNGFTIVDPLNVAIFVNEALVSRFVTFPQGKMIETSSPGLKGQSGGPLMDKSRYICGIQSQTIPYSLDFPGEGRNQFLEVGRATHIETIRNYLDSLNVSYFSE